MRFWGAAQFVASILEDSFSYGCGTGLDVRRHCGLQTVWATWIGFATFSQIFVQGFTGWRHTCSGEALRGDW